MEALIWGKVSSDGADHGPSCAAFASLTLELGRPGGRAAELGHRRRRPTLAAAELGGRAGQTPTRPRPASPRWWPTRRRTGAGTRSATATSPQPGDWAVLRRPRRGRHQLRRRRPRHDRRRLAARPHGQRPLLRRAARASRASPASSTTATSARRRPPRAAPPPRRPGRSRERAPRAGRARPPSRSWPLSPASWRRRLAAGTRAAGQLPRRARARRAGRQRALAAPGHAQAQSTSGACHRAGHRRTSRGAAVAAGLAVAAPHPSGAGTATPADPPAATSAPYRQHAAPASTRRRDTKPAGVHQPGRAGRARRPAALRRARVGDDRAGDRGVRLGPAAASRRTYHNLFGIKGSGPAGSVTLPTQEYENGQWVTIDAQFRVYHNDAESIADHAELLATSGYYTRAMADRAVPDAFANDLTGVYATDPDYGANLIALMKLYNLYQFDSPTASQAQAAARPAASHTPAAHSPAGHPSGSAGSEAQPSIPGILSALSPALAGTPTPSATHTPTTQPSAAHPSAAQPSGPQASIPGILSVLAPAHAGTPTPSATQTPTAQPPATQTPAPQPTGAQPSATQPSTAQPSGSELSGAQASIPGHPVGPRTGAGRHADAERHPDAGRAAVPTSTSRPLSRPSRSHRPPSRRAASRRRPSRQGAQPSGTQPSARVAAVGGVSSARQVGAVRAAAVGGAGVGSWHDVRALTSPRRDPDAERHAAADGHCVTGRDAWHIRRGRGPWRRCDAGERCRRAGRLRAAGKRGDPRRFRRAPRQRGGVRARRRSGSRHRRLRRRRAPRASRTRPPPTATTRRPVRVRRLFRAPA